MSLINNVKKSWLLPDNSLAVGVARKVLLLLFFILLVDVVTRMFFSAEQNNVSGDSAFVVSAKDNLEGTLLSVEQVKTLFAWSDVETKTVKADTPTNVVKKVVKQDQKAKAAISQADKRKAVVAAIAGDKSKRLIGDELLSLKGVFFDQKQFAVVEIENIISNKKQYFKAEVNDPLSGYLLASMGKDHVAIKHSDQEIKLYLFE
jgi:hypothetical protein